MKGASQVVQGKFLDQLRLGLNKEKYQLSKTLDHLVDALLYNKLMNVVVDK